MGGEGVGGEEVGGEEEGGESVGEGREGREGGPMRRTRDSP